MIIITVVTAVQQEAIHVMAEYPQQRSQATSREFVKGPPKRKVIKLFILSIESFMISQYVQTI